MTYSPLLWWHTYFSCQNFGSLDRKWKIETLRLQNSPETPTAGSFILLILKPVLKRESMMEKCIRMGDFHLIALPKNQILDTPNCFPVDSITPTTAFRDYSCKECCCGFFSSKHIYIHLQLSGVDHALKSMSSTCIQESGYIRKSWSLSDRNYLHLPNFLLASIKLFFLLRGMCTETRSENGASHSHLLKIITFHTQVFKQSSIVDLKNDGSTFSYYTPKF